MTLGCSTSLHDGGSVSELLCHDGARVAEFFWRKIIIDVVGGGVVVVGSGVVVVVVGFGVVVVGFSVVVVGSSVVVVGSSVVVVGSFVVVVGSGVVVVGFSVVVVGLGVVVVGSFVVVVGSAVVVVGSSVVVVGFCVLVVGSSVVVVGQSWSYQGLTYGFIVVPSLVVSNHSVVDVVPQFSSVLEIGSGVVDLGFSVVGGMVCFRVTANHGNVVPSSGASVVDVVMYQGSSVVVHQTGASV